MKARLAALALACSWRVAAAQVGEWTAFPPGPTVGDTVWLERSVVAPAGWRVRPGKLVPGSDFEPLADPGVLRAPGPAGSWVVRYAVAVWTPGAHTITLPPVWRLGPNGETDSLPGGHARVDVRRVIPDSVTQPQARGAIAPLRPERRSALPVLAAAALAGSLLAGAIALRRRPRPARPSPEAPVEPQVPDARWLGAGEPRAVAARAGAQLRIALARAYPRASPALSTAECLAILAQDVPAERLRLLAELLPQLDRVAFSAPPAQGADVAALARQARALAQEHAL
ncbi:MAG TPA: hypothetical protein VLV16_07755 [Gemmatimonadales bacterium]|nr:hypothetical protein [Gemmatimonadales bacterium]